MNQESERRDRREGAEQGEGEKEGEEEEADETPSLWDHREAVADEIAAAPGVALCLDFDGTLAPIVEDPSAASMSPDIRDRLTRLAGRSTVLTAVVSGRSLSDLGDRVDVDGVACAGNHGMELSIDGREVVDPAAARRRAALDRLCGRIADRVGDVPGVTVENKGLTATVHYRRVPDDRVSDVRDAVLSAVPRDDDGFEVTEGKAILEIRPPVDADKGSAVERIAAEAPEDWVVVYVGDDVTDEDAFAVLDDGLSVLVGDRTPTAADYRLPAQEDLPELLALVDECVT